MNPLWVDARDYLTSQGQPVSTGSLNQAMNLLASNPQLRPSAVKAGGGAAGIAAGLGAPTDQIVQTPLAPPAGQGITETPLPPPAARGGPSPTSQSAGRGSKGASSGKRTAGGTSASGAAPKDVPGGVGNYASAHAPDKSGRDRSMVQFPVWENAYGRDQKPPMGGYTPPTPASSAPSAPAAPSSPDGSPVGTAQAGTGGDDGGFLSHLMSPGSLTALGGAGAAILAALLMGRGGARGGMRAGSADAMAGARPWGTPDVMADPSAMPMAPYGTPDAFPDPLAGAAPYGTAGALDPPPDPLAGAAPYGTPGVMDPHAPNQSVTPYSGEVRPPMSPELAAIIEEAMSGKTNNNPIGTRKGTQKPYSGAVPPGVQSGIPDPIMQLLGQAGVRQ